MLVCLHFDVNVELKVHVISICPFLFFDQSDISFHVSRGRHIYFWLIR